jgi:Leucine-rich repeat (LRR) protein
MSKKISQLALLVFVLISGCGGGGGGGGGGESSSTATVPTSANNEQIQINYGYAVDDYVVNADVKFYRPNSDVLLYETKSFSYGKFEWPSNIKGVVSIEVSGGYEDIDGKLDTSKDQKIFSEKVTTFADLDKITTPVVVSAVTTGLKSFAGNDFNVFSSAFNDLPSELKKLHDYSDVIKNEEEKLSRLESIKNATRLFGFSEIATELQDDGKINSSTGSISSSLVSGALAILPADSTMKPIADMSLRACISNALQKDESKINTSDLESIVDLACANANIASISGLEQLKNIQYLNIAGNDVSDITPLIGLKNLSWVSLYNNRVSQISPLKGGLFSELAVRLEENCITDLQGIAGSSKVVTLGYNKNVSKQYSSCDKNDSELRLLKAQVTDSGKYYLKYWASYNSAAKCSIDWGDGTVENAECDAWTHTPQHNYTQKPVPEVSFLVNGVVKKKVSFTTELGLATITATPSKSVVGQIVEFVVSNFQAAAKVVWDFGAEATSVVKDVVNGVSEKVSAIFTTTGSKTVTATFKDASNNVLGQSTTTVTVSATAMPSATITGASSNSATQPGPIANNGDTDDTTPTLSGTISAALVSGQKVNVYDGNTQYAATAVVSGTTWTFTPATPLISGTHSFTVEVAGFDGTPGSRSAAYQINVLSTSPVSVTPGEIVRTLSGSFDIVGRDLPTSGLSVIVPSDAKASCQIPTSMTTSGFKVACKFYQLGAQTLAISTAAKLLGTVSVTVKTNVTGVTWTSPSTTNSGTVKFGETVTYKVAGVNLLADPTMGFAVEKCGVSNTEIGTASNTLRTFTCNFNNEAGAVAGQMPGVIKDHPTGQVLLDGWKVPVEVPVASATSKLPDTGITASQCYAAGSDAWVSCTSAAAIALNSKQDGMIGLDVSSPGSSDGKLGFSYSAVGSYTKEECVKDNITGLTWEGKPTTGLRAASNTYTNYGDNRAGDATAYVVAVNNAKLCGYDNWRLPTVDELQGLVDYSEAYSPIIDRTWFPNTQQPWYWTGTGYANDSNYVWVVYFGYGDFFYYDSRSRGGHVRLVR